MHLRLGLLFLLAAVCGAQDRVWLRNGDRVSGRLVGLEQGKLLLDTAHGRLTLPLEGVARLASPRPWRVVLRDGRTRTGPLTAAPRGFRVGDLTAPLPALAALTDASRPPPKRRVWRGRLGASGALAQGNTREKAAHADAELEGRWERTRLTLRGVWDYGERDGKLTARKWAAGAKGDGFLVRRGYGYARTRWESDDFQGLRLRTTVGVGAGAVLLQTKGADLDVELGASWVREDRFPLAGRGAARDQGFATADARLRLRRVLRSGVVLTEELRAFENLKDRQDLRLENDLGLDVALTDGLALTLRFLWQYDNQPVPGAKRVDTRYVAGITYRF